MDRRDGRDRHGRGMRGPLAHPPVPLARTRRAEFTDLVLDAAERVAEHLDGDDAVVQGMSLDGIAFAVEDVPVVDAAESPADRVPLGRADPRDGDRPPMVVVYRRAIEVRTEPGDERAELVHDVVVEQLAELLGMDGDDVDPGFEP